MARKLIYTKEELLIAIRVKSGLSTRRLAQIAKVNPSTINLIENGKRNPTPQTARKICTALACEFDSIFYIKEVKP